MLPWKSRFAWFQDLALKSTHCDVDHYEAVL